MKNLRESVSNLKQLIHHYTGYSYLILVIKISKNGQHCRAEVQLYIKNQFRKVQIAG